MMQRGGLIPSVLMDMFMMRQNGEKYQPVSSLGKVMRKFETRLGAPIYSSPLIKPNQTGSGLRRRRITRKKKRVAKKRVKKKKNGLHSRRIL